jgi:hypothetical protein
LTELLTSAQGFGILIFQHNYLIINLQQVYLIINGIASVNIRFSVPRNHIKEDVYSDNTMIKSGFFAKIKMVKLIQPSTKWLGTR